MKEYSFRTSVQLMKKEMGYYIHTNLLQTEHRSYFKIYRKTFFDKGIQKYLNVLGSAPPPPPLQNN